MTSHTLLNEGAAGDPSLPQEPRMAYSQHRDPSAITTYLGKLPKLMIKQKYLANKQFVKLALRHKLAGTSLKLHKRYLKAGLKVKLTLVNNLFSLYQYLIPYTLKRVINPVFEDSKIKDDIYSGGNHALTLVRAKLVQIIDSNLVDLKGYLNKVMLLALGVKVPTFNLLDTAVSLVFGVSEYSLVRVTRLALNDTEGLVVLKLETATPGDFSLIDSLEYLEEMVHSLGEPGDTPSNLFIKKIVARPRYKSDMKVFLVSKRIHCSLYLDERMLERDLVNGVVHVGTNHLEAEAAVQTNSKNAVDFNNNRIEDFCRPSLTLRQPPNSRALYVTFPVEDCLSHFLRLLKSSEDATDSDEAPPLPVGHDNIPVVSLASETSALSCSLTLKSLVLLANTELVLDTTLALSVSAPDAPRPNLAHYARFRNHNEEIHLPPPLNMDQGSPSRNLSVPSDTPAEKPPMHVGSPYLLRPQWPNNMVTMMPQGVAPQTPEMKSAEVKEEEE